MNNPRDFWQELLRPLQAGEHCVLMCVVESTGSSPGRAGFKMFVSSSGTMCGSIGGGSMEHKLVELARSLMDQPERYPLRKRQVHQPGIGQDRSGMICSGEQMVVFHLLQPVHEGFIRSVIKDLDEAVGVNLELSHEGLWTTVAGDGPVPASQHGSGPEWWYSLPLNQRPLVAILGGGHVSLGLSRLLDQLGFDVRVYDDRYDLNTLLANTHARERAVVDYGKITNYIGEDPSQYIVLASYGYRTDEILLRQLIRARFKYLGMLGSKAKVETMFANLRADGYTDEELARVHAPIGLPINSRTPEEIAVSIAAEIIRVKNA